METLPENIVAIEKPVIRTAESRSRMAGMIVAFIGAIFFSTKAILVKKAFATVHVDAVTLLAIRMLFSLPFYLIAGVIVVRSTASRNLSTKEWIYTIGLGIFGYYLSSLFDFIGLQYISAGLERLILFLYPSIAVLLSRFVFKEPLRGNQILALILTYLGIGIAYFGELSLDTDNPNFLRGSLFIFLCALTYGTYIAGSGRMIPRIGVSRFTAYAMLASTAGVLVHYFVRGADPAFHWREELWIYGTLLAIVATVLPTFMIAWAMKRAGANNVAIISSVGPVSTILQAHYFLGEPVFFAQMVGTALVLAGVLLLGWRRKKAEN